MSPAEVQSRPQPSRCQRQSEVVDCVCEVAAAGIMLRTVNIF